MRSTLLLVGGLLVAVMASCEDGIELDVGGRDVNGSGTIVTETRQVADFDEITLAGEGRVLVTEGRGPSLSIETDDNLMEHIETSVSGGTLEIFTESGVDIDPTESVVYRVAAPEISGLTLTGAGSLELAAVEAPSFDVRLTGAGDIVIADLTADELDVTLTGVGEVVVSGTVDLQTVTLPGAGSYEGGDLMSSTADVSATGVGSVTVWVTDQLNVSITGAGSVEYYGSPTVNQSVAGVGSVNSLGDK